MADPADSGSDIEDVLSSIRRLVAAQPGQDREKSSDAASSAPVPRATALANADKLLLTAALRVPDRRKRVSRPIPAVLADRDRGDFANADAAREARLGDSATPGENPERARGTDAADTYGDLDDPASRSDTADPVAWYGTSAAEHGPDLGDRAAIEVADESAAARFARPAFEWQLEEPSAVTVAPLQQDREPDGADADRPEHGEPDDPRDASHAASADGRPDISKPPHEEETNSGRPQDLITPRATAPAPDDHQDGSHAASADAVGDISTRRPDDESGSRTLQTADVPRHTARAPDNRPDAACAGSTDEPRGIPTRHPDELSGSPMLRTADAPRDTAHAPEDGLDAHHAEPASEPHGTHHPDDEAEPLTPQDGPGPGTAAPAPETDDRLDAPHMPSEEATRPAEMRLDGETNFEFTPVFSRPANPLAPPRSATGEGRLNPFSSAAGSEHAADDGVEPANRGGAATPHQETAVGAAEPTSEPPGSRPSNPESSPPLSLPASAMAEDAPATDPIPAPDTTAPPSSRQDTDGAKTPEPTATTPLLMEPQARVDDIAPPAHSGTEAAEADPRAPDPSAPPLRLGDAHAVAPDPAGLDEEALRRIVAEVVRDELQGELGERITRNIRKLVRREIRLVLAADEID